MKVEETRFEDVAIEPYRVDDGLPPEKPVPPPMRSKSDDLSVWETVKRYKLVTVIAMGAAFSASLDGYRMSFLTSVAHLDQLLTGL